MRVRRLGWAGVEIEADGHIAVIDPVEDTSVMITRHAPDKPLLPPSRPGQASLVAVTHLHADHTDPAAVARAVGPDGVVLRPERLGGDEDVVGIQAVEARLAAHALDAREVKPWERVDAGPFEAVALPAVDGLGAPQVSWIIQAEGRRVLHAGDTVFHGYWWLIARRHGPVDVAFLPVNGAVINFPFLQPASPLPADMTPEQAAVAAHVLGARLAVPIHYGSLYQPAYIEVDQPAENFLRCCVDHDVRGVELVAGQWHDVE